MKYFLTSLDYSYNLRSLSTLYGHFIISLNYKWDILTLNRSEFLIPSFRLAIKNITNLL